MPAITDIPIRLSSEDIARHWNRHGDRQLAPSLRNNLHELLAGLETGQWLDSAIHYRILDITGHGRGWLSVGETRLDSDMVAEYLLQATHMVCGVCTLGHRLMQQIRGWFAEKKHLQAVLLDEIGTLLLYKISDYFELLMCEKAKSMGLQASSALNPGDDGFDLCWQGTVLELAGGAAIGVTMQGSGTLSPHKSLTSVIGLGRGISAYSRTSAQRCQDCGSRKRCPHSLALPAGSEA